MSFETEEEVVQYLWESPTGKPISPQDRASMDYGRVLKFNPTQPRYPKGHPKGGQWMPTGAESGVTLSAPFIRARDLARDEVLKWGARTGNERFVLVSQDGVKLHSKGGGKSSVEFDAYAKDLLWDPKRKITLVHNHPRMSGLSLPDLQTTILPGMHRIEAIGRDGPATVISEGHVKDIPYGLDKFESQTLSNKFKRLFAIASEEVRQYIQPVVNTQGIELWEAAALDSYAKLDALHELGLIEHKTTDTGGRLKDMRQKYNLAVGDPQAHKKMISGIADRVRRHHSYLDYTQSRENLNAIPVGKQEQRLPLEVFGLIDPPNLDYATLEEMREWLAELEMLPMFDDKPQMLRDVHAALAAKGSYAFIFKYDPNQPRHPAGSDKGGQWKGKDGSLPMDRASRLARAEALGFDTSTVYYHGSKQDFDEFNPKYPDGLTFLTTNRDFAADWVRGTGGLRTRTTGPSGEEWVDREIDALKEIWNEKLKDYPEGKEGRAQWYEDFRKEKAKIVPAGVVDSAVYPVYVRVKKIFDPRTDFPLVENLFKRIQEAHPEQGWDRILEDGLHKEGNWIVYERKDVIDYLKTAKGYDAIWIKESAFTGEPHETLAVFDPKNIRSVNASFDPDEKDSRNILKYDPNQPRDKDGKWTKLYHVTQTENVASIQAGGIKPFQTTNWVQAGTGERYGEGQIFAFESKQDAIRWAAKWDWAQNTATGTGRISIIEFESPAEWEQDTADPLGQAGAEGQWLKRYRAVLPEELGPVTPVTNELIKETLAARNKRLVKFDPDQPRHPAGSNKGGQWSKKPGFLSRVGNSILNFFNDGRLPKGGQWVDNPANDEKITSFSRDFYEAPKPGQPFLVYRLGNSKTLENRNAGNAEGVARYVQSLAQGKRPMGVERTGTEVQVYEVVVDEAFGEYSIIRGREFGSPEHSKNVGRRVGELGDREFGVTYSFPEKGFQYKHLASIPLAEAGTADELRKALATRVKKYDPSQPRYPKGHPKGGQWMDTSDMPNQGTLPGILPEAVAMGELQEQALIENARIQREIEQRYRTAQYRPEVIDARETTLWDQIYMARDWGDGTAGYEKIERAFKEANANVKDLLRDGEILVQRSSPKTLEKILADGRMKTQHETKTSKGMMDPTYRAHAEWALFGIGESTEESDRYYFEDGTERPADYEAFPKEFRPIYGHVMDREDPGGFSAVAQYGRYQFVLKDKVADRTTVTGDDSLRVDDYGESYLVPSSMRSPSVASFIPREWSGIEKADALFELVSADGTQEIRKSSDGRYIEAQIHGQVRLQDVAELRVPSEDLLNGLLKQSTVDGYRKAGVKVVLYDERYPAQGIRYYEG